MSTWAITPTAPGTTEAFEGARPRPYHRRFEGDTDQLAGSARTGSTADTDAGVTAGPVSFRGMEGPAMATSVCSEETGAKSFILSCAGAFSTRGFSTAASVDAKRAPASLVE